MRVAGAIFMLGISCGSSPAEAQQFSEPVPFIEPSLAEGPTGDLRYFTAKLSAGCAVRNVYDNFVYGGDFTVALGSNTNGHAGHYYALVNASVGRTPAGLLVWQIRMGHLHEWSVDRIRAGFAPEFGWFVIRRATDGTDMVALVLGLAPHISVDVVQFWTQATPPSALYAVLRAGLDLPLFAPPDTAMANGTLAVGLRL